MARPAHSLKTLLTQINDKFPYRDKASDGGIGDPAHALRVSDHNPTNGVYYAYDFDHDPDSNGLDCRVLWRELCASGDRRIKYVIFNRVIWTPGVGSRPYSGVNAHTSHLHLSVNSTWGDYTGKWGLPFLNLGYDTPDWVGGTYCKKGDSGERVWTLQRHMTTMYPGYNTYVPNGYYGEGTTAGMAEFQDRVGITGPDANGEIVGPRTMTELIQRGFRP